MTTRLFLLYCLSGFLASCNNQTQNPKESSQQPDSIIVNCYSYINNKDTVALKTINAKGAITGTLVYDLYQKDKNKGTIQGRMVGDLLILDYTFAAEGMQSVRQVVFKKSGDDLVEGFGDIEDKNGKVSFKNLDSLTFDNSLVLRSVSCE